MKLILSFILFIFIQFTSGQISQCTYVPNKGYSCNGFQPRTFYYYHVASRTCQPFVYYGCGGNGNRFSTVADCNKACKPGATIISGPGIGSGTASGNGNQPPVGSGTNSNNGSNQIGGGTVPLNQMNMGSRMGQGTNPGNPMLVNNAARVNTVNNGFVGGIRPVTPTFNQNTMSTVTTTPLSMETTTKQFINGYAQMCDQIFAVVINRPTVCGENDACPTGYVCSGSYCCPTKSTVCSQDYDSGKELAEKELQHIGRYAFNPRTQQCSKFSYFGTEGNFNNFKSYNDCMQYCTGSN